MDEIDHNATLGLQYLNAVIEEGLRLLPSIPLGLTRVSPGAIVDGQYIPKGVCDLFFPISRPIHLDTDPQTLQLTKLYIDRRFNSPMDNCAP